MSFDAHTLAFIEGVGGPELMMIMLVVLLLFGGKKLPEFARGFGKSMREFKKAASGVEEELKRAMEEEPPSAAPAPALTQPHTPAAPVTIASASSAPAPTPSSESPASPAGPRPPESPAAPGQT
jgi:sec-independent protein translocase protein TatA